MIDPPIHPLLAARRSIVGFDGRSVAEADLRALFEAARWAPSSRNEQPWSYVVARRDELERFAERLEGVTPPNRVWASHAGALALGVAREEGGSKNNLNFSYEGLKFKFIFFNLFFFFLV